MRKLTLLIVSLLCYVGVLHAQALVADGVYTLSADVNKQRGEMVAADGYEYPVLDGIDLGGYTGNSTAAMANGEYWYVQSVDASSNTYYIYNIAKGKYLVNEGGNVNFGDTPYVWTFVTNAGKPAYLNIKDESKTDKVWLSSGCGRTASQRPVQWDNNNNDGGALYTFTRISDYFATPATGKFYKIKGTHSANPWLTATVENGGIDVAANEAAAAVYLKTADGLKAISTGKYIGTGGNGEQISLVDAEHTVTIEKANACWVYIKTGGRYLYNNQPDYTREAGHLTAAGADAPKWGFIEVEAPAATVNGVLYETLQNAAKNVQPGQTLTLWKDTDETIVLPIGVILEKNGHEADNVTVATPVAKIDDQGYATLAEAITAASAGSTITFVADINGNVTLSKNVTIDGANFNYTGTMSANNALTVTVQNVNFVNGGFAKNNSGTSGTYTIKDCTFDGQGKYAYPVLASNIGTLNVENCTVKDYQYGFLYVKKQSTQVSVKSVSVENCANYAIYLASGVAATIENLNVKNSNNGILWTSAGARTLNLSGCKFENVKTAINSNSGAYVVTANVQGQNNFGTAVLSDNVKCVLAAEDATLAATTAGLNVTTNFEGKEVAYQGGVYSVTVKRDPAGKVAYRADVTDKTDREGIAILLKEPYAKNSLVVKVYNGEKLMFTCTRRDIDDEGKVMFPVTANTTANIVLWGKESGSWINEIHVAPTELNVPNKVEVYADNTLVDTYTHESGTVLGTNLEKYLALDCVKKFDAKIGNAGYETLAAAIEAAKAGEEIVLLRNITASDIITINKAITLNGNGKTLTSTAGRAFNIEIEGKVVINNLTVNAGERAFNIINKPATVELNGVTAVASNNAVMIATSAGAAKVTIDGCGFTGLAVVNVAGANSNVAIKNSTITNVDNNPDENYGAITVWSSAENAVVNVENTTITVAGDSKKAYVFPANATVNGLDENEVGRIIVTVGDAGFDTLAEAIDYANGETITFVMDAKGPGVVINKNTVIDFKGKTYSFTEGVGSTGTPSNGFQILKGNNVTLKNGTLKVDADAAGKFYILVQNYANLTVENMILDGTYLDKWSKTDGDSYVLSNNSGTVNVIGSTIKANDEGSLAFAMDACLKAPYEAPVVTVAEGSTINGNVEVSATLNMNGTLNGTIIINKATGTVISAMDLDVITNVADHKVVNNDGAYTVAAKNYVAQVGEDKKYETFAEAVAAAKAGETITLIADATEDAAVILTKNLKIDGAGHTFTGAIEFKSANGSFTVKNVNFNGPANSDRVYALKSQASTTSLTVEGCTATGYPYGFLYANKAVANLTVKNVTVENVNYGVHSAYGTKVTLENYEATNVKYPVYVQNYGTRNVVLNNCTFEGCEYPLSIWERNQTNKITFNFEGVNEMGKTEFCTGAMAVVNADAIVGTKVYATLADAVEAANAGDEVTLLRNVELSTYFTINKSITLNLGEYNITRDGGTALYVNGDVEVAIKGTTGKVTGAQALFVNNGLVTVNGGHFYGTSSNAEAVYVKGNGEVKINGGTFEGDTNAQYYYVLNKLDADRATSSITVYGGTFVGFNPADNAAEGKGTNFVAEGYVVVDNGDDTYTVEVNPAYGKVAKVGENYYETFAAAVAAAPAGATVTLIADAVESKTVVIAKALTIDGAGCTFTGAIEFNKSNASYTIKNVKFYGADTRVYALKTTSATGTLTVENCEATGYTYGFLHANKSTTNVIVNNVTVKDVNYGVHSVYGTKVTLEEYKATNVKYPVYVQNYGTRNVVLNNCTFEGCENPLSIWERNKTNKITFNFQGVNEMGKTEFCTSAMAVVNADAIVGTKVYATLAAAVEAANAGDEVTLLSNVELSTFVTINKSITLNMGEYNITRDGGTALYVNGDVEVVINATTGTVTGSQALWVANGLAKVYGGNFCGVAEAVYVQNTGKAEIYGGTFSSSNYDSFVLNKKDDSRETASITVYGGTFVGFNPENNAAEGKGTNFVAAGYAASHNVADNSWTVGKAIAQVGEQKYGSIQAAIDAAQDGDIVTLISDVKLTDEDVVLVDNKMKTFCHVPADKNITFNMKEKEISVSYTGEGYLYGVFLVDGGLRVTGNGKIDIPQTDRQVAYMFLKRGAEGYLVVENGTFHAGNLEDSMIYTNATDVVTVKGGTFTIDNIAERTNGCPWIFNAKGNNERYINVTGGTYNWDISNQHWVYEVNLADDKTVIETENGLWTVAEAEAAIDGRGYLTLAAAVEAAVEGETVTLLKSVIGAGLVINKSITIDFNEKIYTVNKAVGSTGTETLGLQILKDNDVTLTNGTLTSTAVVEGKQVKMLVQNYANLTLKDMNLVDATGHILYALSNNSGETYLKGNTNITTGAVAFDSYYDKSYDAPTVYVETTGTITGAIEKSDDATIAISSGIFTAEILPAWCAEYHVPVQNADGTWTVESRYIDELAILDDGKYTYDFVNDMTVGEFKYTRTFPAVNLWQTAYFPFEIPVEVLVNKGYEVGYFYDIHFEFNDGEINMQNNPDLHIMKVKSGTLRANYPYVIKPTAEDDLNLVLEFEDIVLHSVNDMKTVESSSTVHTFEFAGLYTRTLCSEFAGDAPCYTITTKGEFKKVSKTANLPSLRVYMTIKAKDGEPVIFNETNAPEYIRMRVIGEENEDGTTTIYDVNAEEAEEMIFDLSGRRVLETEKGIYIKNGKKVLVK